MKKQSIFNSILIVFLISCFGCDKEDKVSCISDCTDTFLLQNDMVRYKGEEIGCKFFLSLYEYKNKQYFLLENHCADMASYPTDCDGNKLCEGENAAECNDFYANAKYIGVIGIKE